MQRIGLNWVKSTINHPANSSTIPFIPHMNLQCSCFECSIYRSLPHQPVMYYAWKSTHTVQNAQCLENVQNRCIIEEERIQFCLLWCSQAGGKTLIQYINLALQKVEQDFLSGLPPWLHLVLRESYEGIWVISQHSLVSNIQVIPQVEDPGFEPQCYPTCRCILELIQWPCTPTRGRKENFSIGIWIM